MENSKRKAAAKRYYSNVSRNEILSTRMSPVSKGDVVLKVFNPTFKSVGGITIGIRPEQNQILLMSEIGIHGMDELTNWI